VAAGCGDSSQVGPVESISSDTDANCEETLLPIPSNLNAWGLTEDFLSEAEIFCAGSVAQLVGRDNKIVNVNVPSDWIYLNRIPSEAEFAAAKSPALKMGYFVNIPNYEDSGATVSTGDVLQVSVYVAGSCDVQANIDTLANGNTQYADIFRADTIVGAITSVAVTIELMTAWLSDPKIKYGGIDLYGMSKWCMDEQPSLSLTHLSSSRTSLDDMMLSFNVARDIELTAALLAERQNCKNWSQYEGLKRFSDAPIGIDECFDWCISQNWTGVKHWRDMFQDRNGQAASMGYEMYEGGFQQFVEEYCGELSLGTS
jgi:hypothetical protein